MIFGLLGDAMAHNDCTSDEFNAVKARYTELRSLERERIIKAMVSRGYRIMNMTYTKELSDPYNKRAGRGLSHYTSDGRIATYNLSNWMWINAMKNQCYISVSLNSLDIDEKTGNIHALFDRLSIYCQCSDENAKEEITRFDLPFSDDELEEFMTELDRFIESLA
jgi:hypothetical protein